MVPSPDIPETSPSSADPSDLHTGILFAITIQFHHCMSGDNIGGGILHIMLAGPPRHTAVHTPSERVGVTYIRMKLVGLLTPSTHHAPRSVTGVEPNDAIDAIACPAQTAILVTGHVLVGHANGDIGHITGIGTHTGQA